MRGCYLVKNPTKIQIFGSTHLKKKKKEEESWNCCTLSTYKFTFDSVNKESAYNAEDPGSIPRLGRFPREGNGNPPQYSCLENSMDREAWRARVYGIAKSQTQLAFIFFIKLQIHVLGPWATILRLPKWTNL